MTRLVLAALLFVKRLVLTGLKSRIMLLPGLLCLAEFVSALELPKPVTCQPYLASIGRRTHVTHSSLPLPTHQVRRPGRDLPLGILGALFIVTTCYMLMSAALVMMVPLDKIDLGAPFAAAFEYVGEY
jgi:hypothetical protein